MCPQQVHAGMRDAAWAKAWARVCIPALAPSLSPVKHVLRAQFRGWDLSTGWEGPRAIERTGTRARRAPSATPKMKTAQTSRAVDLPTNCASGRGMLSLLRASRGYALRSRWHATIEERAQLSDLLHLVRSSNVPDSLSRSSEQGGCEHDRQTFHLPMDESAEYESSPVTLKGSQMV